MNIADIIEKGKGVQRRREAEEVHRRLEALVVLRELEVRARVLRVEPQPLGYRMPQSDDLRPGKRFHLIDRASQQIAGHLANEFPIQTDVVLVESWRLVPLKPHESPLTKRFGTTHKIVVEFVYEDGSDEFSEVPLEDLRTGHGVTAWVKL